MSELPDSPKNTSAPRPSEDKPAFPEKKPADTLAQPGGGAAPDPKSPPARHDTAKEEGRTLGNHPVDPNAWTSKVNIPPGISAEDAIDPGSATPGAAPVDNRSGEKK